MDVSVSPAGATGRLIWSNESLYYLVLIDGRINGDGNNDIFGSELSARFDLSRSFSLMAYWDHKLAFEAGQASDRSPKHLMGLGGRFRLDSGLLGSLFAFSRSEFTDRGVQNLAGVLEDLLVQHMDNAVLLMERLGWAYGSHGGLNLEAGMRISLPISFTAPHFRFRDEGGGITTHGRYYGGYELARAVTAYLQGSF